MERPVGRSEAEAARRLADSLGSQAITAPDGLTVWFPRSRKPEAAYNVYRNPPSGYSGAADRILSLDVACSDIQPGLSEDAFRLAIRELLSQIPLAERLLAETHDLTLTRADSQSYLDSISSDDFSSKDLWLAFVGWMAQYFPDKVMKQEMTEIALRRAIPLA